MLEEAILIYGPEAQVDKAIEEMSELIKALLKLRYAEKDYAVDICTEAVAEEMADVEIMLEQLRIIFKNQHKIDVWRRDKISRLERRLENIQEE